MKKLHSRLSSVLSLGLLLLAAIPGFAQEEAAQEEASLFAAIPASPPLKARSALDRVLYDYSVLQLDTGKIEKHVRKLNRLSIRLGNQRFDLEVEPNDLRAPGYRRILMADGVAVELDPGPVETYKGQVAGDPESFVRLRITPSSFSGYIKTADEWTFIGDLDGFVPVKSRGLVVVYGDQDVRPTAAACGLEERAAQLPGTYPESFFSLELGTKSHVHSELEVATECDSEYSSTFSDWSGRIAGILNAVEGIYESQLNTGITLTYQQCWFSASTDPYTSTDAETRLNQFRNYWQANRSSVHRDTAHMWTGADLDGSIIGIAWVRVTCSNPGFAYGLSQNFSPSALAVRLTAHEIAHNLGANHDDEAPVCSGVDCFGTGPIMCSSIQGSGSDIFSSCSRSVVGNHIDAYGTGCLFTPPPSCVPQSSCFSDEDCLGGVCVKDPEYAIQGECAC